jgi:hypothetical protein
LTTRKYSSSPQSTYRSLSLLVFCFFLFIACVAAVDKPDANVVPQDKNSEHSLSNARSSIDELCKDVLKLIAKNDMKALKALALTEEEFKQYYWPYSDWSRPEVRMPFEFYWGDLHQKSSWHLRSMLQAYGGEKFEFIRVDFKGETMEFGNAKAHRDSRLIVKNEAGKEVWIEAFGSVFEMNGQYKVFSFIRRD